MKRNFYKAVIIFACVIAYFGLQAQEMLTILPVNKNTNKIEYSEVVQVDGSSNELYKRSIDWINLSFKNASSVTKVRDEASGIIEGQHRIRLMNKLEDGTDFLFGHVQYNFKLEFKDGRYRYIFNDFVFIDQSKQPIERWQNPKDTWHTKYTVSHLEQIDAFMKDLIKGLKKEMLPKVEVKDEW